MKVKDIQIVSPQEGKQTQFIETSADIAIYGGSAGGGKTYALLLEAIRNIQVAGFGAVIFRKSLTQITKEGALWDTADVIYPRVGGRGVRGNLIYYFDRYKTKIDFAYLSRDADVYDWQGTQIPLICFDELTHFSKKQFFYMLSRNRSVCGVKPYVRATTNPDPDSWVREFIDWWIDDDGLAIEERSGAIRWFVNQNDEIHWFDTKKDAEARFPTIPPKSFTFISSSIKDNKILMEQDPNYVANLEALGRVERARLLDGNWNVRQGAGDFFKRRYFEIVDAVPPMKRIVRCWDLAGTTPSEANPDPDWTVGMKVGICEDGYFWILDVQRDRIPHPEVEKLFVNTHTQDGKGVEGTVPLDAGSAGKAIANRMVKLVAGYPVRAKQVTGDKETRAKPASAQAEVGNIKILRAKWNEDLLKELEGFPLDPHDDCHPFYTKIKTSRGEIPLSEVKENDYVKSYLYNGSVYSKVKKVIISGKKEVYRLTTESGRTIEATSEHPLLIKDEWVQVKHIEAGDKISCYKNIKAISLEKVEDTIFQQLILMEKEDGFTGTRLNKKQEEKLERDIIYTILMVIETITSLKISKRLRHQVIANFIVAMDTVHKRDTLSILKIFAILQDWQKKVCMLGTTKKGERELKMEFIKYVRCVIRDLDSIKNQDLMQGFVTVDAEKHIIMEAETQRLNIQKNVKYAIKNLHRRQSKCFAVMIADKKILEREIERDTIVKKEKIGVRDCINLHVEASNNFTVGDILSHNCVDTLSDCIDELTTHKKITVKKKPKGVR